MNFIWGLIAGIVMVTVVCLIWLKTKKLAPLDIKTFNGVNGDEDVPKRDLMAEAKEKHTEMILKLKEYLKEKTEITNNEVQNYLGVSDASAERYLDELESQGKLKQIGKVGYQVKYKVL